MICLQLCMASPGSPPGRPAARAGPASLRQTVPESGRDSVSQLRAQSLQYAVLENLGAAAAGPSRRWGTPPSGHAAGGPGPLH